MGTKVFSKEADAMEVEGAEEEEMMEGEVALQVQGTTFLLPPSPQEFQRVEKDLGRQLTEEEHEFVDAQLERKAIQAIQTDKRSAEQTTRLKKLQNFINHAKKKLQDPLLIIKKPPAKTLEVASNVNWIYLLPQDIYFSCTKKFPNI